VPFEDTLAGSDEHPETRVRYHAMRRLQDI
jgi:hypothetical protein